MEKILFSPARVTISFVPLGRYPMHLSHYPNPKKLKYREVWEAFPEGRRGRIPSIEGKVSFCEKRRTEAPEAVSQPENGGQAHRR